MPFLLLISLSSCLFQKNHLFYLQGMKRHFFWPIQTHQKTLGRWVKWYPKTWSKRFIQTDTAEICLSGAGAVRGITWLSRRLSRDQCETISRRADLGVTYSHLWALTQGSPPGSQGEVLRKGLPWWWRWWGRILMWNPCVIEWNSVLYIPCFFQGKRFCQCHCSGEGHSHSNPHRYLPNSPYRKRKNHDWQGSVLWIDRLGIPQSGKEAKDKEEKFYTTGKEACPTTEAP